MVYILFEFKESINWSSKKFRMAESISYIFVLFFRSNSYIVFVTFCVVVITSDWSIKSFLLPFKNMLEGNFDMPRSIRDKSVLVLESPNYLVLRLATRESEVR